MNQQTTIEIAAKLSVKDEFAKVECPLILRITEEALREYDKKVRSAIEQGCLRTGNAVFDAATMDCANRIRQILS